MRIRQSKFDLSWRWDSPLPVGKSVEDTLAIIMALTPSRSIKNENVDIYICWDEMSIHDFFASPYLPPLYITFLGGGECYRFALEMVNLRKG